MTHFTNQFHAYANAFLGCSQLVLHRDGRTWGAASVALLFSSLSIAQTSPLSLMDSTWHEMSSTQETPLRIEALPQEDARVFVGVTSSETARRVDAFAPSVVRDDRARSVNVGLDHWKAGDTFTGTGSVLVGLDAMSMESLDVVSGWISDWESDSDTASPRLGGVVVLRPHAQGSVSLFESETSKEASRLREGWFIDKGMALVLAPGVSLDVPVVLKEGSTILLASPSVEDAAQLGVEASEDKAPMLATIWAHHQIDPSVFSTPIWIQTPSEDGYLGGSWHEGEVQATPTGWGIGIKHKEPYPAWWKAFVLAKKEDSLPVHVRVDIDVLTHLKHGISNLEALWQEAFDDRYVGTLARMPLGLSLSKVPMQVGLVRERRGSVRQYEYQASVVLSDFMSPWGELGFQWTHTTGHEEGATLMTRRSRLHSWGVWLGSRQGSVRYGVGIRHESGRVNTQWRFYPIADTKVRMSLPWRAWSISGLWDAEVDTFDNHTPYGSAELTLKRVAQGSATWREGGVTLGEWRRAPQWRASLDLEAGYLWRVRWTRDEALLRLGLRTQLQVYRGGEKSLVTSTGVWQAPRQQPDALWAIKGLLHTPFWGGWLDIEAQAGRQGHHPLWLGQMRWSYRF